MDLISFELELKIPIALKNAEKGPTYVPCVSKKQVGSSSYSKRQKYSEYCAFDKLYMTIWKQVKKEVYRDINMPRLVTISRIFAHHDA